MLCVKIAPIPSSRGTPRDELVQTFCNNSDELHVAQAVTLARQAIGLSDPNPRVGCVLTDVAGQVIGQGHTQQAGGPHAEVMALRDAQARGHRTRGATAYVALEPCSHHGRTPPCAEALVRAEVARVVVVLVDPNPLVAGQGVALLRAAGIAVDVLPADGSDPAENAVTIVQELAKYSEKLAGKPRWLVFNKLDAMDPATIPSVLVDLMELDGQSVPRIYVSAHSGQGFAELRGMLAERVVSQTSEVGDMGPDDQGSLDGIENTPL